MSLHRGTHPTNEGSSLMTSSPPPKAPLPNTVALGVRPLISQSWENTNVQCTGNCMSKGRERRPLGRERSSSVAPASLLEQMGNKESAFGSEVGGVPRGPVPPCKALNWWPVYILFLGRGTLSEQGKYVFVLILRSPFGRGGEAGRVEVWCGPGERRWWPGQAGGSRRGGTRRWEWGRGR